MIIDRLKGMGYLFFALAILTLIVSFVFLIKALDSDSFDSLWSWILTGCVLGIALVFAIVSTAASLLALLESNYTARVTGTYTSSSSPSYDRFTPGRKPIIHRPTDIEILSDSEENTSSAQTSVNCSRCGFTLIPGRYYCGGCGRYIE